GRFYLEDLKSRNGTLLNNEPVTERRPLKENDRIKICDVLMTFHDSVRPLPAELRPEEPDGAISLEPAAPVEAAVSNLSSFVVLESQPAEKLKALLEISTDLARTLALDSLLPKILDSLFSLFRQADRGFVILRDPGTQKLI